MELGYVKTWRPPHWRAAFPCRLPRWSRELSRKARISVPQHPFPSLRHQQLRLFPQPGGGHLPAGRFLHLLCRLLPPARRTGRHPLRRGLSERQLPGDGGIGALLRGDRHPLEAERKGCVLVNDFYYAKQAACALIESGCRQVFMLSGHPRAYVSQTRKPVSAPPWRRLACPAFRNRLSMRISTGREARQATLELLKRCPETDGIFCASDYMALGCHSALQHLKKKIPEEVSLFGFDGLVSTQMVHPTIATVRQDSFSEGLPGRGASAQAAAGGGLRPHRHRALPDDSRRIGEKDGCRTLAHEEGPGSKASLRH